jgi:hypothetical protein
VDELMVLLLIMSTTVMSLALTVALPGCVEVYRRFQPGRTVFCPETERLGSIVISPIIAAATSALAPCWIHVTRCSLWDGRRCRLRRCVKQLRSGMG